MTNLTKIKGMNQAEVEAMANCGVNTVEQLLEAGASRIGRMRLTDKTRIPEETILRWVQLADIMRIPKLNQLTSVMIEQAGIFSPMDLASFGTRRLLVRLSRVAAKQRLIWSLPSVAEIENYVAEARKLQRFVTY